MAAHRNSDEHREEDELHGRMNAHDTKIRTGTLEENWQNIRKEQIK